MNDFIILGTDTDAGKTTFALLWLHCFADEYQYWKPVETGESDSARVESLVSGAVVHPSLAHFKAPVAPLLAARLEGATVPSAKRIAQSYPRTGNHQRGIIIETFGSPFSPLNDQELQLSLIQELNLPCILVSSATLGCIGRSLQCLAALRSENIRPLAVVLLGKPDGFAAEQIQKNGGVFVGSLAPPAEWTPHVLAECAKRQRGEMESIVGEFARREPRRPSSSTELISEDRRAVWHPYTPLEGADDPLPCVAAQDEFLELADGRRVIDAISSWWTILHGHRHPPLMHMLADASRKIDHVLFAGVTHPYAVELADLLLGTMPWCGGRVFYSDNGSTAVEVALKIAYQFWCHWGEPQRTRFVGFEHGYHGDTIGAMSVGRDPVFFGLFEPLMFRADLLPIDPHRLDEHLQRHASETAAVILEPLVQGAGGMRIHSPDTLRQVIEITHRNGVLFIADEVMTGGGRTGTLWAHQASLSSHSGRAGRNEGLVPDLVCAAKTLTGGILPLAATLAAPKIVAAFQTGDRSRTFFHGHSFTANPLACAIAAKNIRLLLEQKLTAPARMEQFWNQALRPLQGHRFVKEVRIRGSIAAIEVLAAGGYLADVGRHMRRTCLDQGVFLRPLGNVLYAMPPYCVSADSLKQVADAMIAAVHSFGQ